MPGDAAAIRKRNAWRTLWRSRYRTNAHLAFRKRLKPLATATCFQHVHAYRPKPGRPRQAEAQLQVTMSSSITPLSLRTLLYSASISGPLRETCRSSGKASVDPTPSLNGFIHLGQINTVARISGCKGFRHLSRSRTLHRGSAALLALEFEN